MSYEFFIAQRYFKGDRNIPFWLYTLIISLMIIFFPVTLVAFFWVSVVEPAFTRLRQSAPWRIVHLRVLVIAELGVLALAVTASVVALFDTLARALDLRVGGIQSRLFGLAVFVGLVALFRPVIGQVVRGQRHVFASIISFLSIFGICIGVAALIITLSVMNGFESEVRSRIIGFDAHVRVRTFHQRPMENYQAVMEEIRNIPHVVGMSPYIIEKALIKSKEATEGLVIKGVDPQTVTQVSDLAENINYGQLNLGEVSVPGREPLPGIVLGYNLADRLMAGLGDEVIIISPAGITGVLGQIPPMKKFRVAGYFETGMFEFDDTYAYISLESAQPLFRLGNSVSGIEIKLDDRLRAEEVASAIDNRLGYPYRALTWFEMNKTLFSWMTIEKWAMFIILSLIILVAAFNIISSLIMVVLEKTKEIGILKSMGATSGGVMKVFMFEGLVAGSIGTVLGCILGYVVCWAQLKYKFLSLPSDIYFISSLPIQMRTSDFVSIVVAAFLLCFTATLYPSWKAARLDPVVAIRYE